MQNAPYTHSGSFGPALVAVPVLGSVITLALSYLYAYICVYSPIAGYISILFVLGFGFAMGFSISLLGHWGKCRNSGFLYLCGALLGCLALYTSWIVFIYALLNKGMDGNIGLNLLSMFLSPASAWEFIVSLNETGWYSIKSWTPSGMVLWIFWGIEALGIVGMPTLMGASGIDAEIFCETCAKWCDNSHKDHLALPESEEALAQVQAYPVEILSTLERVTESVYPRIDLTLYTCTTCNNTAGFAMALTTVEFDKEGKAEEKSDALLTIHTLPHSDCLKLKALADRKAKGPSETDNVDTAKTA